MISKYSALLQIPFFEVGTHGEVHAHLPLHSADEQKQEILGPVRLLKTKYGHDATLFRPPYGEFNDDTVNVARALGLQFILWNVVSGDPDPTLTAIQIEDRLKQLVRKGSVIVMHANGKGKHTHEVVQDLHQQLLPERHLTPMTVSDLLICNGQAAHERPVVRPMTAEDRAAVIELLADSDPWKTLGYQAKDWDGYFTPLPHGRDSFVADQNGRVAGIAIVRQKFLLGDYLELLGVADWARDRGQGNSCSPTSNQLSSRGRRTCSPAYRTSTTTPVTFTKNKAIRRSAPCRISDPWQCRNPAAKDRADRRERKKLAISPQPQEATMLIAEEPHCL